MRKEIEWSPETGADKGKNFVITRMSAFDADKWASRLIRSLMRAGAEVPDNALEQGMLSLAGAATQIFSRLSNEDCEAAQDRLFACCKIRRGAQLEESKIIDADIDDAQTIYSLREQAFRLHLDFFKAAAAQISPLAAAIMEVMGSQDTQSETPT